tara:strand:- start:923 stop:2335 length:1413 start_codon:yes stop_codon:yes gene_type:complete
MADLNALIAQGYQFQPPPDPFVQYGRMQQLQQGEQANQLNQLKMQEAQRAMEETNALRRLDPASATYLQDVTRISPEKGFAFAKSQQEAKTAGTEGQIKSTKLIADKLALLPDAYRMADTPEAYLAVHKSVHADPVLGPYLQSLGATPEKGLASLEEAVRTGKFPQLRMGSMQSVSQLLDSMKPVAVSASSSIYDPSKGTFNQAPAAPEKAPTSADATTMQALGYPLTPEGFAAFKDAQRQERMLNPAEEAQKIRIAKSGATTLNVSNVQEKAEAADYGKLLVKDYDAVKASASLAQKSIPALESNLAILNKGFDTGSFTESKAAAAKVLGALGVKEAEKYATDSQAFLANASAAVLQRQLEQKGPQTEADAQRITQTGAQLGNTKAANEFVLKVAKSQLQRDIEQRDFYAAWRDKNQTFNGAENAWNTGPGSKSLFERPELKAYATGPNVKEVPADRTKGLDKIFGGKR